jgi:hypothetical protein
MPWYVSDFERLGFHCVDKWVKVIMYLYAPIVSISTSRVPWSYIRTVVVHQHCSRTSTLYSYINTVVVYYTHMHLQFPVLQIAQLLSHAYPCLA